MEDNIILTAIHESGKELQLIQKPNLYKGRFYIGYPNSSYIIKIYLNRSDNDKLYIGSVKCITPTGKNQTKSASTKQFYKMYKIIDKIDFVETV